MKGLLLTICILLISIFYLDAFLPNPRPSSRLNNANRVIIREGEPFFQYKASSAEDERPLSHADIVWKVRPPAGVSRLRRLWLRFAANVIRLDCILKRQEPPLVLCPKGGQTLMEAYYHPEGSSKGKKIGRFGFTTERGPSSPPILESIKDIYGLETNALMVGVGAIIFMYVEPKYRKKKVGALALEVISLIQAIQASDFTLAVVDDDGSGKLVEWYEKHGYSKAPKLQEHLGSPNGIHGITMIAPTKQVLPNECFIKWW